MGLTIRKVSFKIDCISLQCFSYHLLVACFTELHRHHMTQQPRFPHPHILLKYDAYMVFLLTIQIGKGSTVPFQIFLTSHYTNFCSTLRIEGTSSFQMCGVAYWNHQFLSHCCDIPLEGNCSVGRSPNNLCVLVNPDSKGYDKQ